MTAKKSSPKLLPADNYEPTEADNARETQEEGLGMTRPQDPLLNRVAKSVDPKLIKTPLIQDIVRRLHETAGSQQKDSNTKGHRMLVGLAAPQIGESWRIVLVDTQVTVDRRRAGQLECLINPEIVWRSRETEEGREGCFSAGPVWGLVRRPIAVKVRAYGLDGKRVERVFEDFTARIVQHEVDHLSGIRFPDRITSDKKRHWVHAEELTLYPENMHHWHRLCSKERWEKFKVAS